MNALPFAIELPLVTDLPERFADSDTLRRHYQLLVGLNVPARISKDADYEDSIEMAARTQAALAAPLLRNAVFVGYPSPKGEPVGLDGKGLGARGLPIRALASLDGAQAYRQEGRTPLLDADTPYWASDAFLRHAGRAMTLCRNCDADEAKPAWAPKPDLYDTLRAIRAATPDKPLAHKFVGRGLKQYAVTFATAKEMQAEIGYDVLDNWNGGSLVQDAVRMTYEYRMLVVDWSIIAGSGAIASLTADDATAARLDDRVCCTISDRIENRADIVREHRLFAEEVLRDMQREKTLSGTFTLDVYRDGATGRPGIVELNPLGRAGWYAADPRPVLDAVARMVTCR